MNKLIEKMYDTFEIGEPIFPKEILCLFKLSKQIIYLYLKEGLLLNQIKKRDKYYYIPKYEKVCGVEIDNQPTYEAIITKKYLGKDENIKGVYAGRTLENKLNISEQVPFTEEIVSNEVKEAMKKTKINGVNVILKKPYTKITKDNYKEYILLQLLNDIDKGMLEEKKDIVKVYIKKSKLSKDKAKRISKSFPMKARKRLEEVL